jgi:gamma-glutamyltranspeptidase/glutathione hydrolase
MSSNMSRHVRFVKEAARGRRGAVAAKNQLAADVGAKILSQGGNAVDACIATALALAVLEPWTSGLSSAGCVTIWDHKRTRGHIVDFPAALPSVKPDNPAPRRDDIFDDQQAVRLAAYRSIAVPGLPDGLWSAHTFGTMPWPALVAPAVGLSEEGLEVDWYAALTIGLETTALSRFPASREWLLPEGPIPSYLGRKASRRLRNSGLTAALKSLAERGGRDFYDGMIGYALADDLARGGSTISQSDLRSYRARIHEPMIIARRGKRYLFPPESILAEHFCDMMKSEDDSSSPFERVRVTNLAQTILASHAELRPGDVDLAEWSSHVSVIDGDGNMASLSQSLGSLFGSKVALPSTGILANNFALPAQNGFEPGKDRSVASHYLLPVIALSGERAWLAIGVSGNRHILPTLVQIVSLLSEFGFAVEDAFHHARLGVSLSGQIEIDASAPHEIKVALKQVFRAVEVPAAVSPFARHCPIAVHVDLFSGERVAMTDPAELWSGAAAI